jgi:hypothetical protein
MLLRCFQLAAESAETQKMQKTVLLYLSGNEYFLKLQPFGVAVFLL